MKYIVTGHVLATFLGGYFIDNLGVPNMLIIGTAVAVVGTMIVWIFVQDKKENQ